MEIIIHILRCGYLEIDKSLPFTNKSANPLAFAGIFRLGKTKMRLPVFTFLIEHPNGNILIDTSFSKETRKKSFLSIKNFLCIENLPEGESIDEVLEGIDIDYVILTHMHNNHVGGLNSINDKAKHILASKEEFEEANKHGFKYDSSNWRNTKIECFDWNDNIGPFNSSYDMFGDNSVNLVHLPGHSKGLIGVLIRNNGKFILIVGDCGLNANVWKKLHVPKFCYSKDKYYKSLEWINEISNDENCLNILSSHDIKNLHIKAIRL